MMGRQKMGCCIVLMVIMSAGSLMGLESASLPRTTLQTCQYWAAPDDTALQVGKVVLNFSENPMVHPLPSTIYTKKNDHIFFIPTADVSDDQLRIIMEAVKKNNNPWYSLSISREEKPIAGIKVVFSYDADKVSIEHKLFDTLGTQKGVMFRLYNKAMIDAIKAKNHSSLLRVAMVKPLTVIA
jgi:hypothetical protein